MEITFDIPQAFSSDSSSEEKAAVRQTLNACLRQLTRGNTRQHVVPTLKKSGKTLVTFNMPSVFHEDSSPLDNVLSLQALLYCLSSINLIYLKTRPYQVTPLYNSGVYYDRTSIWDSIPALYARGFGDCKSLACAYVAECLLHGIEAKPVFRWVKSDGNVSYHILVQTDQGWHDPSKVLGMGSNENAYFSRKTG